MTDRARALLTGWFSFLHGEATAGDLLAAQSAGAALRQAGLAYDTAWSPVFRPEGLRLDAADPGRYTHLVFACGPLHSCVPQPGTPAPLPELHRRFAHCRRIAVGVPVPDPADPAVLGFHTVPARDGPGMAPAPDPAEAAAGRAAAGPDAPARRGPDAGAAGVRGPAPP